MNKEELKKLAEEVETWVGGLRYNQSKIDNNVPLDIIIELAQATYPASCSLIYYWVNKIKNKGYEVPEHIANKILLIKAFQEDKIKIN